MKNAVIISVNDFLEHDFTMYNKSIFLGETASIVDRHENWDSKVLDVTYQRPKIGLKLTYKNSQRICKHICNSHQSLIQNQNCKRAYNLVHAC